MAEVAGPLSPVFPNDRGVPAKSEITPAAQTRRLIVLPVSVTTKPPAPSGARPHGALKAASVAAPPSPPYVALPLPATVAMLPF